MTAAKYRLTVVWESSKQWPPVSDYDVEYRRAGRGGRYSSHSFSGTGTTTTITGLSSNTTYEVRVRAENAYGEGPWSDSTTATTERDPPGKPAAPTLSAGKHSVTVTWTKPSNTGPPISDYDVEYRREGRGDRYSSHSFSGTGTTTTITGLSSNTTYEVQVRAENADGESSWSDSTTERTERDPPGKPAAPTLSAGKHSVTVTWTKPSNTGPPISDYDVEYRREGRGDRYSSHSFSGTGTATTITGLSSNTTYEVRVRAENADGESSWSDSTTERTERDPPGKPAAPTLSAGKHSVTVTWTKPSNTGPPISDYDVEYRREGRGDRYSSHSFSGTGTATTITGLSSNTTYEVRVRAENADGESSWSDSTTERTERDPPGKPAAPTLSAGKHSVTVTWTKPSNTGPPISDYDVEYRRAGRGDRYSSHSFSGTGTTTTITGLSSNTTYEVRIRAENADGESSWSDSTTERTERDPPGKPAAPTLSAGKHSVTVTWTKPSNTGPPISDYDVEYRREGRGDRYSSHSFSGTGTTTTITGLSSNTTYEVRVRAENADGESSWSDSTTERTERDPPGKPAAPTLSAGKHSVTVTWTKPSNTGPTISDYDVEYRRAGRGDRYSWHSFSGTGTATTITGLSSNTTYEVRVRAQNADGESGWSDSTTERTERDPPRQPDPPTVRAAGTSALTVTWREPSNTGPPISHYDVQFRELDGRTFTDQRSIGTVATITGLLPGRSYEVQVRAMNADGTGAWSEPGLGETAALTVGFGASTYAATEGGTGAVVTVSLSAAAAEELTIPITVSAGATTEPGDYAVSGLSSGAVTFAVGASSRVLTVTANEDTDSADESVELGFGELPVGVSAGTPVTAAVVLTDDDPLTVTLSGPAGPVDGEFEVTVSFSEEVMGFEAADVTVSGGTVTVTGSGAEYVAAVRPSGSGTVTVDVAAGVVQDAAGNGNEAAAQFSVEVRLSCSSGVAVTDAGTNAGLVADCEALLAVKDELAGTATLNWGADVAMSLWDGVTAAGTPSRVTELRLAGRGLDGTLPAGLSGLSSLTALDLSNNGVSGRFPSALGSLGALRELKVQRTRLSGCVPEALRARLDSALSDLGDLTYCDEGPGRPERPVVLVVSGNILVVDWDAPASRKAITGYELSHRVAGEDDSVEASYPAVLTVATITGLLPGRSYEVQVRAMNADGTGAWSEPGLGETAALTVGFGASTYAATEGGTGAVVTVSLSAAAAEELTIPITVSAGATTEPGDYAVSGLSSGAVTFAVGASSRVLTVTANEDTDSADESVELGFGELPVGVSAGTPVTAAVVLTDDDPLTVTLSGPAGPVDGEFEVTVSFSEEVMGFEAADVTVSGGTVTVTGSGAEYVAAVRPSGSGTVTVDVAAGVVQDAAGNGNEAAAQFSVEVRLSCSSGVAVTDAGTNAGLVADCEALLAVKDELAGTATLNWGADVAMSLWDGVTAAGTPSRVTELRLAGRGLDGTLPAGLSGLSSLTALDLSNNGVSGRFPSALGSLGALRELKVQRTRLSGCVPEALRARLDSALSDLGDLTYCDEGPGRPERPVVLVMSGNILVVDWDAPASRKAITGYELSHRVAGEDDSVEASYPAVLTVATITGLLPGRSYEVQVRAMNADGTGAWSEPGLGETAALTVGFGASTYAATEGGTGAVVTVSLSAAAAEELTIPITVSAGATTEPGDYAVSGLSSGAVTFAVGASSRVLTVTANEDTDSADESVELGFGELPVGVSAGTPVTAAVVLTDDDPLTVTLSGPAGPVDGEFEVTVSFSEEVMGFEAADVTVSGGTVTVTGSGAEYVAAVRPSGSGTVTVDVAAGVVQDAAGNGNEAAAQFSVVVQHACSSGVAVPNAAGNPGLVRDCGALLAAKDELAGTATLNWNPDVAMSSWDGVKTAGNPRRVTRLELRNRQLSGTIPTALGSLPKLKRLDLGNNRLNGAIPSDLGDLRNLTRLYLHSNELSGSIPSELGDLSALKRLWLSANDLSGLVPGELGSLAGLVELYLQSNRLSGCVPSSLGSIARDKRDFGELRLCNDGPPRPLAPTVAPTGPSSVSVAWTEPVVSGLAIDSYDVQHREVGDQAFISPVASATDTTTTITGLLPGRTYVVQVRANSGGRAGPWSPSGVGTTATLTVTFGPGPFTAIEGGSAETIVVALSTAPTEVTAIPITATGVDTTESADYAVSGLSGGALTFAVNERMRSITVAASQDHDSADEAVLLGFGTLPRSVSEGTLTTARVTLADDDAAPLAVGFGSSAYTAVEGGRAVTIPVRLNQPALHELRIAITATARGTTDAGDYAIGGLTAGVLTFAAGDDTKNITVAAVADADATDEAVVIGFGAGVPTRPAATAEVRLDDDDTEPLTAAFGAANYTAAEGGAAVSVAVELSQRALSALSVPITVHAHGTTAPGDYVVAGLSAGGAALFAPGERVRTFTVTAVDDADDADETVVLGFGAGLPAGSPARSAITLQDDDRAGVSYGDARYRVAEGGSLTVQVKLLPVPAVAVTIPITVATLGATAAGDYVVHGLTPANGLTFAAGDGAQSFVISGAPDVDADDERLALGFGTLPAGIGGGAVASAEVTIVDDESAVSRVSFIGASYQASEGSAVAVTVRMQPQATTARTVSITTTPRGTTASGDYSIAGRTLTIGAGQSTGVLTITANEDADAADEVVELGFGALPAGISAGVQATTEVVLTDNDAASLEAAFGSASHVAAEGSTAVAVAVNLSQTAQSEVSLPITVTPRGTTTASDYVIGGLDQDRTLRFAAGMRSQTLTVSAAEDADSANEAVVLGFGEGTVPAGQPAVAVVRLQDNDTTALNVQFAASSYPAIEGGAAATVAVSLNQPALAELAIPITSAPRGTTRESDYRVDGLNADAELVFAVGEQRQSFSVTANVDADAADEAVELGFGGVVPAGRISVAVVSLQEPVIGRSSRLSVASQSRGLPAVSFFGTEHEVTEGAAVSITVRLSAVLAESVAVPITATPRGTTLPEDYTLGGLNAGALVFEAGDREKAFTVRANEDADAQHEAVELAFGTLPDSVTADSHATATVWIADDERAVVERITRVNAALIPHVAQATTASAIDAISGRIASARTGTGQRPTFDTAGLERLYAAVATRGRGGTAAGQSELPGAEQVLGDTSFALPVAAVVDTGEAAGEPAGDAVPALWGTGDYRNVGSAASGADAVEWSGSLFGAHVGLDTRLGSTLLAGVALSWSRGTFEYRDRLQSPWAGGTHRSWTLSAYPYLSWAPSEALWLWAAFGYGGGQIEVDDDAADVQTGDVKRVGAAGGMRATLSDEQLIAGGTTSVTALGEGAYTWTDVAGRALIESLMVQVWEGPRGGGGRVRACAAMGQSHPTGGGSRDPLRRWRGFRRRRRGNRRRVEVSRAVGADDRRTWQDAGSAPERLPGVGRWRTAEPGPGKKPPGSVGERRAELRAVCHRRGPAVAERHGRSGVPVQRRAGGSGPRERELSYGVLVADRALITPYGGITFIQDGMQRYEIGGKLDLGPKFGLDLKGEHEVAPSGAAHQQFSIEGTLRL